MSFTCGGDIALLSSSSGTSCSSVFFVLSPDSIPGASTGGAEEQVIGFWLPATTLNGGNSSGLRLGVLGDDFVQQQPI